MTRRSDGLATLLVGLATPSLAGAAYQSDLATVLGGLFAIVLTFDYADELPVLFGVVTRRKRQSSPTWRTLALRLAAALAVALALSLFFFNRYVYRGFGMGLYLFRGGNPHLPFIAVTFDDGPDPNVTPAVLDILRQRGVKATFFMVGSHAEDHWELARRVVEEGHEVGNHTYSHRNLVSLGRAGTCAEFLRAQEALKAVTGVEPRLFRPPRGLYNRYILELAREHRVTVALWTRSSRDWLELRPDEMVRGLLQNVRGGDVLLFHDGGNLIRTTGGWRQNVVEGLPVLLDELDARGFKFVTVSELMIISGLTGQGDGLEMVPAGWGDDRE
jgi:peptidoglycan/xylan/chitin deacetylase (PgdA/CDA1 family)